MLYCCEVVIQKGGNHIEKQIKLKTSTTLSCKRPPKIAQDSIKIQNSTKTFYLT